MERKTFTVRLERNPSISINVIPGHFTTGTAHISHYLDVSGLKSNALIARDVARELAIPYLASTLVETIVCMENTDVIGAYLAEELIQDGVAVVNSGSDVHIVTPLSNANGKLVFHESEIKWITNRNILLLVATVSSGRTVKSALDCLAYYGGRLDGISALFLASQEKIGQEIHALFTSDDIEGYSVFSAGKCEMCKAGQKLDAIISSEGYTKIPAAKEES